MANTTPPDGNTTIHLKLPEVLKETALEHATNDSISLSAYLRMLILADHRRRVRNPAAYKTVTYNR